MVDWEAELTAVIGRPARDVSIENALGHVAGYTVANDLSARDFTKRPHIADNSPFKYDWLSQKCFEDACPVGPWIVPDLDVQDLAVTTRLDGRVVQDGRTADMVFDVPELVSYVSRAFTLLPGDVILTGTPAGVGQLAPGQRVEVEVEGIGVLSNPVVQR